MTKRKKPQAKCVERAPVFVWADKGIVAINFLVGLASTGGVILTIDSLGFPPEIAIPAMILGGAIALMISLMPVALAPAWALATGMTKMCGALLIGAMMFLDGGSQTNLAREIDARMRAPGIEAIQTRLTALEAKADLDKDVHARVSAELHKAKGASLDLTAIGWLALCFQLATFFTRAWLSTVTAERDEYLKAMRRLDRQKRPSAQVRKPQLVPSAAAA